MAKKRNLGKKHKFKHSEPSAAVAESAQAVAAAPKVAVTKLRTAPAGAVVGRDFSYVLTDLRRIGIMAVTLILLQAVLWYLFNHTGLGDGVYNLIQV